LLMQALRLIKSNLADVESRGLAARERLVVAALLCGRGTEQGGTGLASVLAHAIGHRSHVANGIVNAIVLPHTMRYNAPVTMDRGVTIIEALAEFPATSPTAPVASTIVGAFLDELPVPRTLRQIGVGQEDLADIADAAMTDWFVSRNARPVAGVRTLLDILEAAW
jgi:alcohol dehydrogenase class IV